MAQRTGTRGGIIGNLTYNHKFRPVYLWSLEIERPGSAQIQLDEEDASGSVGGRN